MKKALKILAVLLALMLVALLLSVSIPNKVEPIVVTDKATLVLPKSSAQVPVKFSVIKTADAQTQEAFAVSGGSLFTHMRMVHSAVLVQHGDDRLLIDGGLGNQVDTQYETDMPAWVRPMMKYVKTASAHTQLTADKQTLPTRIFLTHAHWDHASGLADFPDAEVWLPESEREFTKVGTPPTILPSQVNNPKTLWRPYILSNKVVGGFTQSYDLYGDGSVVLLGMSGHTPGSIGVLVQTTGGKQVLFIGDTAWHADGVKNLRHKGWAAGSVADNEKRGVAEAIARLHNLQAANEQLLIVPAHDAKVQDALGYYPQWVE